MPANSAEDHLAQHAALVSAFTPSARSDAPAEVPIPPRADAGRVARKDNATSTAEPVQGAQGAAEIAAALEEGLARRDRR